VSAATVRPRQQRLRPLRPAVLALGSNLGDRETTIREAVAELDAIPGVHVDALSPLVETPALTLEGIDLAAPAYLNAVVTIHTALDAYSLLDEANAIENAHGRVRDERWGSRTLDVDIIDFDGREFSDDRLTLPHPRAWERAFVLAPWLAIDPDAMIPGRGRADVALAATTDTVWQYPRHSETGQTEGVEE
jgi:2-amino-4-hydroxy-6-hydroxymethyldihydropteridine diphosphokinase